MDEPSQMFGWHGRLALIDMTCQTFTVIRPETRILTRFIGGRGLGGYYLAPHVTCAIDDPRLPVMLMTGPLVGTPSPTSGRLSIISRSPLTGTVGDASVGGRLGTALKKAGWDGVIIIGKADDWRGIQIRDQDIRFTAAGHLCGLPVDARRAALPAGFDSQALIGPAAENGVRFANIMVDGHFAAGRGGLGLVLAAKQVGFIQVSGTGHARIHDPVALKSAREDVLRLVAASPALSGPLGIGRFGTPALYDLLSARHMMPTDNFKATRFANAANMNGPAMHKLHGAQKTGCRGCQLRCKQKATDGRILPEFETLSHFSALLENNDLSVVMAANQIANQMGMDTISAAVTLACHAEIRGRSLAPTEILDLLNRIGTGQGLGRDLGQGAAHYAASKGRPESAMTVKGQELPAYDPRGAMGMALSYAVATRGGCHLRAYPISHEILRKPVATERFTWTGKARIIKIGEDQCAMADSLTACKFTFLAAGLEEYAAILSAVTGIEFSGQDLLAAGERISFHERMMNNANGFDSRDDDLPERFFTPPTHPSTEGGGELPPLNRQAFLEARRKYYKIRGLDSDGRPTREKATELGLSPMAVHSYFNQNTGEEV